MGRFASLMATPPDYLDPQLAYTTEAAEADWIAYTPLLTYRHKSGADGTELIPGLAQRLPRISPDGRTYRLDLRKGLVYLQRPSGDGERLRVHDRARDPPRLAGQAVPHGEHRRGRRVRARRGARHLRHLDRRRERAGGIKLVRPWGAFENILALPATGLVPSGTPMRDLSATPPPGVGAYRITDVVPGRRWTMVRNDRFEPSSCPTSPREPGEGRRQDRPQPGGGGEPGDRRPRGRLRPGSPAAARHPGARPAAGVQPLRHASAFPRRTTSS